MVCRLSGLTCLGQRRHCDACAVASRADRSLAKASAAVILENARRFQIEHPAEWAAMQSAADAGTGLSDTEALGLLLAVEAAEVEALRRIVEGKA